MTDTPTEREVESTWTRLRRRKVVQWGVVYVAAAWGFLQGLEYLSEAFHWPDQLRQIAVLVLLIGLPIVLVLAWYHGDRGQQRVSTPEFAILTLLLLLGGGAFWYYQRTSEAGKDAAAPTANTAQPAASPAVSDARPSVAVLPFENRSREADDVFFVDGIHDDILTQLSKVSALRVISRTSVEQFRDTKLSMKAIADQLGVTRILEGGVQRAGDRVRVNVQLIDAGTDAHVWAESYDRELSAANIFAIQSEVAAAIADALKATLTPAEKARVNAMPTQNLEAWETYHLGKQRMAERTSESLVDAERLFRRAITLDSTFALAYAGLADTLAMQTYYSGKPEKPTLAEAEKAAARALELNPNLAEAWAASSTIASGRSDLALSEQKLRRAIELNPNYAHAHHLLGVTLKLQGRLGEAIEHWQRAVELDPLSVHINNMLGIALEAAGQFDGAAARYQRAVDIDPKSPFSYVNLADLAAYARNQFDEALPLIERAVTLDSGNPQIQAELAFLRLDIGDAAVAKQLIREITRRWPDDSITNGRAANVYAALDDRTAADRHARKALATDARDAWAIAILRDVELQKGNHKLSLAQYESSYPELLTSGDVKVDAASYRPAIDLFLVLQRTGDVERASNLLDRSEQVIRSLHRLGWEGYGIADVQIHALRGDKSKAIAALRAAKEAGWRGPLWRYHRDFDSNLASIRNEPEFKAVFADIERDMAKQRARLAARPKDAPLQLTDASR